MIDIPFSISSVYPFAKTDGTRRYKLQAVIPELQKCVPQCTLFPNDLKIGKFNHLLGQARERNHNLNLYILSLRSAVKRE